MRTSPLFLASVILLFVIPSAVAQAQRRRTRPRPAPTKQTHPRDETEQEIEYESELLRQKLKPEQILYVESVVEKLWRAYHIYKITSDMNRTATDFFTDWNAEVIQKVIGYLPDGKFKLAIQLSVLALSDAYKLHQSYFSISGDVSTDEVLRIVKFYKLETVPQLFRVSRVMDASDKYRNLARVIAERTGLNIREP